MGRNWGPGPVAWRGRRLALAVALAAVVFAVATWPWYGPRARESVIGVIDGAFCDELTCPPSAPWTAPVDAGVSSGFRTQARPDHHGVDLGARRGSRVVAASGGVVVAAECQARRDGKPYGCERDGSAEVLGCGWFVKILHANRIATLYCHLGREPEVAAGDVVTTGQLLGYVGSTGNSSEPHLHFEVQRGTGFLPPRPASAVDPREFLGDLGIRLR